ncbi:MAG: hypothetical protein V1745_01940 [Patescibacteria group bacterium]
MFVGVDVDRLSDPHGAVRHANGAWRQRDAVLEVDSYFVEDGGGENVAEYCDVACEFEESIPQELALALDRVEREEDDSDDDWEVWSPICNFPPSQFLDPYEDEPEERIAGTDDERQYVRKLHRREEYLVQRIADRKPPIADMRAVKKARRILNALLLKQADNEAELADIREVLSRLDPSRGPVASAHSPTTSAAFRKPPKDPHEIQ